MKQLDEPNVVLPLASSVPAKCERCEAAFQAIKPKHGPVRSVCDECTKERRRQWRLANRGRAVEYKRGWRSANSEKVRAQAAALRRKYPERHKQYTDKWRQANQDRVKRVRQEYVARERERLKVAQQEYRTRKKSEIAAKVAAWQRKNAAYCAASRAERRAMELKATPAWANDFFIAEAYHLARLRSQATGYQWHVDHIVPLKSPLVCGLHVEHNLQVIPASVNVSKKNRHWPDMPCN